jgi:hypothetical protein
MNMVHQPMIKVRTTPEYRWLGYAMLQKVR